MSQSGIRDLIFQASFSELVHLRDVLTRDILDRVSHQPQFIDTDLPHYEDALFSEFAADLGDYDPHYDTPGSSRSSEVPAALPRMRNMLPEVSQLSLSGLLEVHALVSRRLGLSWNDRIHINDSPDLEPAEEASEQTAQASPPVDRTAAFTGVNPAFQSAVMRIQTVAESRECLLLLSDRLIALARDEADLQSATESTPSINSI